MHQGDRIDETAFKALVRAAVTLNTTARAAAKPSGARTKGKG
jgi:hypothetical protein